MNGCRLEIGDNGGFARRQVLRPQKALKGWWGEVMSGQMEGFDWLQLWAGGRTRVPPVFVRANLSILVKSVLICYAATKPQWGCLWAFAILIDTYTLESV